MDLSEDSYQTYIDLCKEVERHNENYFALCQPSIEDALFDALVEKVRRLEERHPEWAFVGSPLQKIGERTTPGFQTARHKRALFSLDKAFTLDQVQLFYKRMEKKFPGSLWIVDYKIDGCALSIWYEKGRYTKALTRGDGQKGDDVTANIWALGLLPYSLKGVQPDFLEMRAELYMSFSALEKNNERRAREGLPLFANTRNATAGSLKLLDPQEVAKRQLSLAIYAVQDLDSKMLPDLQASWKFIEEQQLPTIAKYAVCRHFEEIEGFVEQVRQERALLPFAIDGVVVKLLSYRTAELLGATGQYYRWGIAYKFSPTEATTRLLEIQLQLGRTGVVTPVASLEPVFLEGSLISRCTLHNGEEIKRKDLRAGDYVRIAKGGDVIPKIIEVDLSKRDPAAAAWIQPTHCPSCGDPLVQESGEVALRCLNFQGCRAQQSKRLSYFVSKEVFDIEGLGECSIELLLQRDLVRKGSDFFKLQREQLLSLEGFGELSVDKLCEAIAKRKKISFDRFLLSLGIKHVGVSMAKALASYFSSFKELLAANREQLLAIEGVGQKAADAILTAVQRDHPAHILALELLEAGVSCEEATQESFKEHSFQGKVFVLTGSLQAMPRSRAAELIRERGGSIRSSLSKKTDYLLAGEEAGSKLEQARDLNLSIWSEEDFLKQL